ncbi:MAG: hydrogenase maturation nickel metallochaperone HypA [bacterium]|nr:hydrogenase maturation nickel metallochaperone HypA [bacterium]
MTEIIERACSVASSHGASRITAINITCGALSGVLPDALRFCFDICAAGTIAQHASLNINIVPARWSCNSCSASSPASSNNPSPPVCPSCGSPHLRLSSGREFFLDSIEIL